MGAKVVGDVEERKLPCGDGASLVLVTYDERVDGGEVVVAGSFPGDEDGSLVALTIAGTDLDDGACVVALSEIGEVVGVSAALLPAVPSKASIAPTAASPSLGGSGITSFFAVDTNTPKAMDAASRGKKDNTMRQFLRRR